MKIWEQKHSRIMWQILTNKTMKIYPQYSGKIALVLELVNSGYVAKTGKGYTFTERGKDWVLALNPNDFVAEYWFERTPNDVKRLQDKIKDMDFPKTPNDLWKHNELTIEDVETESLQINIEASKQLRDMYRNWQKKNPYNRLSYEHWLENRLWQILDASEEGEESS